MAIKVDDLEGDKDLSEGEKSATKGGGQSVWANGLMASKNSDDDRLPGASSVDVAITPSPAGPVPIPYPVVDGGESKTKKKLIATPDNPLKPRR